jgi:acetyl esterase/lipase
MKFGVTRSSALCCVLIALSILSLFVQQPQALRAQGAPPSSKGPKKSQDSVAGNVDHENWDSLSIADSDLHADPPLIGLKEETPEFTRELIQVKWRVGDPIDLWVIRPRGVENPPVVLYLYGYPSEADRFRDDRYCTRVAQGGFAAVGFVSALTGHRYHSRPMKEWFVSELEEALVKSTHDVQMIINYLSTRDDMDVNRVGMFGQGSGGTIAILAAAVDPRIKAVDTLNPWGDWPDWMAKSARIPDAERPRYVTADFQKQIARLDPIVWLPKLSSRPTRIQSVMDDLATPEICKKKIEAAAPRGSAQIVRWDDSEAQFEALNGHNRNLFEWIKEQLQPAAKERAAK